ncbi:hypothetical protein J6T66_03845 [bacterium]|nr:hypothetical protein [bacterium]
MIATMFINVAVYAIASRKVVATVVYTIITGIIGFAVWITFSDPIISNEWFGLFMISMIPSCHLYFQSIFGCAWVHFGKSKISNDVNEMRSFVKRGRMIMISSWFSYLLPIIPTIVLICINWKAGLLQAGLMLLCGLERLFDHPVFEISADIYLMESAYKEKQNHTTI